MIEVGVGLSSALLNSDFRFVGVRWEPGKESQRAVISLIGSLLALCWK